MSKDESLDTRLIRQHRELNELLQAEQPGLEKNLTDCAAALDHAARQDDGPEIGRLRKLRDNLLTQRGQLTERAEHKRLAIEQTRRDIAARDRAIAVEELRAHAQTARDIGPQVDEAFADLVDALQRFRGQMASAYGVATTRLGEDWQAVNRITSHERLYGDLVWHLAGALGIARDPAVHGAPSAQADELHALAHSLS